MIDSGAHDNVLDGNVISGSQGVGVIIQSAATVRNVIRGNFIGTDALGATAVSNGSAGVVIADASNNLVGGTAVGAGNVISGNRGPGVAIRGGEGLAQADLNVVQGNFIGTAASGRTALPNRIGVQITGEVKGTLVGNNILSGNDNYGVVLVGSDVRNNRVVANTIGTTVDGAPLGNGLDGVLLNSGAHDTEISSNHIAYNGGNGVAVGLAGLGSGSTGNSIRFNSIHDNGRLGIDLGSDGVTPNDPLDPDAGPNGLQNFPVVLQALDVFGVFTVVIGALDSLPGAHFTIDIYASPSADLSSFGEGQLYLGSCDVTTVASGPFLGLAVFGCVLPVAVAGGWVIATTATDAAGNTSEFSQALDIRSVPGSFPGPLAPDTSHSASSRSVPAEEAPADLTLPPDTATGAEKPAALPVRPLGGVSLVPGKRPARGLSWSVEELPLVVPSDG
jgi:hypothetical protein